MAEPTNQTAPGDGVTPLGEGNPSGGQEGETFTKAQVEKMMKDRVDREKASAKKDREELLAQLNALKEATGTSEAEKVKLQEQIDSLEQKVMSAEDLAKKRAADAEAKREREVKAKDTEVDKWQGLFKDTLLERSITDAAVENKAFRPGQVVSMLRGDSKVVEVTENGQPTGRFEVQVEMAVKGEDGSYRRETFPVAEGVKRFLDANPNLIAANVGDGSGSRHLADTGNTIRLSPEQATDPAAYRAAKAAAEKQGKQLVVPDVTA